jgi:hypothetical protein
VHLVLGSAGVLVVAVRHLAPPLRDVMSCHFGVGPSQTTRKITPSWLGCVSRWTVSGRREFERGCFEGGGAFEYRALMTANAPTRSREGTGASPTGVDQAGDRGSMRRPALYRLSPWAIEKVEVQRLAGSQGRSDDRCEGPCEGFCEWFARDACGTLSTRHPPGARGFASGLEGLSRDGHRRAP